MITKTVKIVPTGYPTNRNFIEAIKAVRAVTSCGLKEAKDIMDAVTGNMAAPLGNVFALDVMESEFKAFLNRMAGAGFEVTDTTIDLRADRLSKVKELMLACIESKHYDLAKGLMDILERFE